MPRSFMFNESVHVYLLLCFHLKHVLIFVFIHLQEQHLCFSNGFNLSTPWASYQIHKIAGCACAGNAGNVRNSDPDMHHGTCVTHVPWCMPGSLTSGFLWSRCRRKRSRLSRRMHNPQFYVSGKRPMAVDALAACAQLCFWLWRINRLIIHEELFQSAPSQCCLTIEYANTCFMFPTNGQKWTSRVNTW